MVTMYSAHVITTILITLLSPVASIPDYNVDTTNDSIQNISDVVISNANTTKAPTSIVQDGITSNITITNLPGFVSENNQLSKKEIKTPYIKEPIYDDSIVKKNNDSVVRNNDVS
uniref:Secreted protein n=1 Tax=Rhabditophanes sp. KR3021 TaxID=114890 RepID=A0AC35U1Z1_9BILA